MKLHIIVKLIVILLFCSNVIVQDGFADLSKAGIMVHGGTGSPANRSSEIVPAVEEAITTLRNGGSALDAAVAAVVIMENNPMFNAGTGGNIRLDGETVQMDAAVMNGNGDFGAVAVIQNVRNPILVAKGVMNSPHLLISGEGATRFARTLGYADWDPRTPTSIQKYTLLKQRMDKNDLTDQFENFNWKKHWNFPRPLPKELVPNDTVGAVVHDGNGGYAAAISTGGTSTTMYGRVGDVPIMGAGSFAGEHGAVCATGWGEYIIRERSSEKTHNLMGGGASPQEAVEVGINKFPDHIGIGLIAVSNEGISAHSNRNMAWAGYTKGNIVRADEIDK